MAVDFVKFNGANLLVAKVRYYIAADLDFDQPIQFISELMISFEPHPDTPKAKSNVGWKNEFWLRIITLSTLILNKISDDRVAAQKILCGL